MSRVVISDLDEKVNKNKSVQLPEALRRIMNYITKEIDPTFDKEGFKEWLHLGEDKPFKSGKNRYYWD